MGLCVVATENEDTECSGFLNLFSGSLGNTERETQPGNTKHTCWGNFERGTRQQIPQKLRFLSLEQFERATRPANPKGYFSWISGNAGTRSEAKSGGTQEGPTLLTV